VSNKTGFILVPTEKANKKPELSDRFMLVPPGSDQLEGDLYTVDEIIDFLNQHLEKRIAKGSVEVADCSPALQNFIIYGNVEGRRVETSSTETSSTGTTPTAGTPTTPSARTELPESQPGIPKPEDNIVVPVMVEDPTTEIPTISPRSRITPPTEVSAPVVYHPSIPQGLFIIERDEELLFNYKSPKDVGGASVTYQVAIKAVSDTTSVANLTWIDKEDSLSHLFQNLTNGTEYFLYARARNSAGFSLAAEIRGRPVEAPSRALTLTITPEVNYYTRQGTNFTIVTYLLRYSEPVTGIDNSEITINNGSLVAVVPFLNQYYVQVRPNSYTEPVSISVGVDAAETALESKIGAAVVSDKILYSQIVRKIDPPGNVQVTAKDKEVVVEWDAPDKTISGNQNLQGFQISLDGIQYIDIASNVFSHRLTGLTNNQEISIYLRSESDTGYSDDVIIKATPAVALDVIDVPAAELPSVPRNVAYFLHTDGSVEVRWEAPIQTNFEGFEIRKNSEDWISLEATIRKYIFSSDSRWEIVKFYLRSTNGRGHSDTLELSTTVIGNPDPIENVVAEAGNGIIKVTWDELSPGNIAGENDFLYSCIQYAVVRIKKTSDGSYPFGEDWAAWGCGAVNAYYVQLENEEQYTIEVSSRTTQFQSSITREVNVTPSASHAADNAPTAPQNLALTAGSGELVANWDAPSDTGGGDGISHYELWIRPIDSDGEYVTWQYVAGDTTTFTFSNLNSGQSHTVRLRAINNNGTFGQLLEHPPISNRLVSPIVEASGTPT